MKFTLIQAMVLLVTVFHLPEYSSAMPAVTNITSESHEMTSSGSSQPSSISTVQETIKFAIVSSIKTNYCLFTFHPLKDNLQLDFSNTTETKLLLACELLNMQSELGFIYYQDMVCL